MAELNFLKVSHQVIKFAGFEANKTHTVRIKITNICPAPKRI